MFGLFKKKEDESEMFELTKSMASIWEVLEDLELRIVAIEDKLLNRDIAVVKKCSAEMRMNSRKDLKSDDDISMLKLDVKLNDALIRAGYKTIGGLYAGYCVKSVHKAEGVGRKSIIKIENALKECGYEI